MSMNRYTTELNRNNRGWSWPKRGLTRMEVDRWLIGWGITSGHTKFQDLHHTVTYHTGGSKLRVTKES